MKKQATVEDVLLAFLKEIHRDTLLHPNLLEATAPDLLWDRATKALERRGLDVSAETQQMMTSRLYRDRYVNRVNRDDGSHLLQISDDGIAAIREIEAALEVERKEAKEDRRWRIGVYFAIATLASGAIGFLAGILVSR